MIFKQINRLCYLDQLIRQQRTGSAYDLAQKLQISRRQVYNLIDKLKDLGFEVDYDRYRKTFLYPIPFRYNIELGRKNSNVLNTSFL